MAQKYDLATIRHSAAHVLAQAVLILYPDAKLGFGPAIDDGFYYDFDLEHHFTDDDLVALEAEMNRIIEEKQDFSHYDLPKKDAVALLKKRNQLYKLELIEDLALEDYSVYENGPFLDLCRGPHVENTRQVGVIKLLHVAGAYWKGTEKNKMLQRIYGTAFPNRKELRIYLDRKKEAEKRDHRVLGKALNLFSIEEEVGAGLILWHPKGARIRSIIEAYWKEIHFKKGYDLLYTPHIGRANLWETSGHLECYHESMYNPIEVEEQDYYIKPMNCPFHMMVYKHSSRSYRDLPLRYAELGDVYRFERSGTLHGLMRVRGFTQDDAHIICTPDQVQEEVENVLDLCLEMLKKFGFSKFKVYLSTKPEEKSVGADEMWQKAESVLEAAIKHRNLDYEIEAGGGAFYGPKIDVKIEDAIGRQWQCSTVQFDFNLPERFDMTYIGADGEKHQPYVIHRALLGSIERFFGILIEHYAGKFPAWLAPVQVKVLSVDKSQHDHCEALFKELREAGVRVELDNSGEKLGYKIRQGVTEKVPYMLIVGKREEESDTVAIRSRDEGDMGVKTLSEFLETLQKSDL